ncbi:hypothetical protein CYMTET_8672 [Cymbomonas tetramitiformis]|uniref:Uncharacterized protein n=1 Tax=Cymbomonas tetramitiformis TaxID=36881 RepID=A0AAE0LG97_9CHLO|nr:hypothetical protein CYMTET_8672 [Cymbomonas tetramitiformis]|eukprot:gene2733-3507_t
MRKLVVVDPNILTRIPECVWETIFLTHFDESERQLLSWVSRGFRAYFTQGPHSLRIDASVRRFSRKLVSRELNFVRRVARVLDCFGTPFEDRKANFVDTYPRKSLGRAIYTSARWDVIEWAVLHDEPGRARARLTIDVLKSVVLDPRPFTAVMRDLFNLTRRASCFADTRRWMTTEGDIECTTETMRITCDTVGPNSVALFAYLINTCEAYTELRRCSVENVSEVQNVCACFERCASRRNLETAYYMHHRFGEVLCKQPTTIRILKNVTSRLHLDTRDYDMVTFLLSKGYGGKNRYNIVFAGLVRAHSSGPSTAGIVCRQEAILRIYFNEYKISSDMCELVAEMASDDIVNAIITHIVDARTNRTLHECLGRRLRVNCAPRIKEQNRSAVTDFVLGLAHATDEDLWSVSDEKLKWLLDSVCTNYRSVEARFLAMRNPFALLRLVSLGAWKWSSQSCTRLIDGVVVYRHDILDEPFVWTSTRRARCFRERRSWARSHVDVLRETLIGMRLAGSQPCALDALANCMTRYTRRGVADDRGESEFEREVLVRALVFATEDSLGELSKTDRGLCERNTTRLVDASVRFGSIELARVIHDTYGISLPSMDTHLVARFLDNIVGCRHLYYLLRLAERDAIRSCERVSFLVLATWIEHCVTKDKESLFSTVCHFFTQTRREGSQSIRTLLTDLFRSARANSVVYRIRLPRYRERFLKIRDGNAQSDRNAQSVVRTKPRMPCWFTDPELDLIFTDREWDNIMRPCRLPDRVRLA